jgi:hypothetical protein
VQASYTFKIPGYLPENKFAAGRSPVEWAAVIVVVAGRYCVEEEEAVVVVAVVTGRSCSAKEAAVVAGRFGTQEEIVAGRCGGGATIEARALLWHWPKPTCQRPNRRTVWLISAITMSTKNRRHSTTQQEKKKIKPSFFLASLGLH